MDTKTLQNNLQGIYKLSLEEVELFNEVMEEEEKLQNEQEEDEEENIRMDEEDHE